MDSTENKPGVPAPDAGTPSEEPARMTEAEAAVEPQAGAPEGADIPEATPVSADSTADDSSSYNYYDDYGYEQRPESISPEPAAPATAAEPEPAPPSAPPPSSTSTSTEEPEDDEEEGMLRMSFLEHLEELRSRILKALLGVGVAFVLSLYFVNDLWAIVEAPAKRALEQNGVTTGLAMITPTEAFSVIWVKLPILTAIFVSSPWILYQVWAFIAPGLYKRERRWAAPFVICTAGLFIIGGLFAYFVAFRLGLAFLLGIGMSNKVQPVVSITEYFDLFVNVSLGLGLVFELPVLIFFLALLRIVTPGFLVRNSRYAILIIVVIAAIITPTPDIINLMLISVPMSVLYFAGVFAAYLLWLSRENKRFPWGLMALLLGAAGLLVGGAVFFAVTKYGYRLVQHWPFLVR